MSTGGQIQKKAIRYAKAIGLMVRRNYMGPGAETGWPDTEFFYPPGRGAVGCYGKILFIEFKSPNETIKKRQQFIMDQLLALGHRVRVCRTFEEAKLEIDSFGQELDLWL